MFGSLKGGTGDGWRIWGVGGVLLREAGREMLGWTPESLVFCVWSGKRWEILEFFTWNKGILRILSRTGQY